MYDYKTVKSIHDQRMRQFMIEAERAHLLRQLRRDHQVEKGLVERWLQLVRSIRQAITPRTARPAH